MGGTRVGTGAPSDTPTHRPPRSPLMPAQPHSIKLRVVTTAPEPPHALCACGCGEPTKPSDRTDPKRGVVRGQPLRYVNGHNRPGYRVDRYEIRDCGYDTPCWVWKLAVNAEGYGYDCGKLAHRAIYEQHVGPIPPGLQLDHLCRNRGCVNPAHLEPVSNAVNTRRGAKTKLTADDIEAIRQSDASTLYLGRLYGVHPAHISRIRNHRRWVAA